MKINENKDAEKLWANCWTDGEILQISSLESKDARNLPFWPPRGLSLRDDVSDTKIYFKYKFYGVHFG